MSSRRRDIEAVGAGAGIDDDKVHAAGTGADEGAGAAVGRGGVGWEEAATRVRSREGYGVG